MYYTCTPIYARTRDSEIELLRPLEDLRVCLRRGYRGGELLCDLYVVGPRGARLVRSNTRLRPDDVDAIVYRVSTPEAEVMIADFQRIVKLLYAESIFEVELVAGGARSGRYHVIYLPFATLLGTSIEAREASRFESRIEVETGVPPLDPPGLLSDPSRVAGIAERLGSSSVLFELSSTDDIVVGSVIIAAARPLLARARAHIGYLNTVSITCYVGVG